MEALKLSPSLEVREINDRASFVALEGEWNALVVRAGNEPFYRHEFIRVWIDNFAPQARLRVLIVRDGEGRLTAVLPLMEERTYLYGVPVRQLVSTANVHSCRFDLVADDGEAASAAIFGYLAADKTWDLLRIIDVPEGGKALGLLEQARRAGFPTGTYASIQSPYVPLNANWEEQQGTLQTKFKANVRRRRKKLEEKGQVTFERVESGKDLEARLDEGYALEASGWKGQQGTAIALDKATRGFYSELARTEAYQGNLTLYFMRVDGRAVGFHYGLTYDQRYFLLKPGYDEALRECSPGQLLMEEVLKECVERKLREFDFLGPDMTWKRDWTDRVRMHTWLFVFRNDRLGRALCSAKFKWVPAAREVMASWKK
ncbi:MAG: GNAT family N-acetyltransferase [Myxococcota bacterium]|nr:GNAT family N-acetyltransferase [Myxococcota bacterium]